MKNARQTTIFHFFKTFRFSSYFFTTIIAAFCCSPNSYSQNICHGDAVVFNSSFYQCNGHPWTLVFYDDFNGNNIDTSIWEIRSWAEGALYGNGGNSQEYNTLDNAVVSNGTLKIIAKRENIRRRAISWKPDEEILSDGLPNLRTYNYTSSNIWTKTKFMYGKFEARIKIPKGKGFWPAFWTFGGEPWNEIDIFEFWNENNIFGHYDESKLSKVHHMNIHYDYDNDGNSDMCPTNYSGNDFSQNFHIFTMTWEKDKIQWFVDGDLKRTDYKYYSEIGQSTGCYIDAWHRYISNDIFPKDPMSIILNLAIQNGDDGPNGDTPFPSEMEIDWVRYYQRTPCQDTTISNADDFSTEVTNFNAIAGQNVTFDCDLNIQHGEQLDVIANSAITIKHGFKAESGSSVHAYINPQVCGLEQDKETFDGFDTHFEEKQKVHTCETENRIKIFPNPNNGHLIIDLAADNSNDYTLVITNSDGKTIQFAKTLGPHTIYLNLTGIHSGIYTLQLHNIQKNITKKHKIIIP